MNNRLTIQDLAGLLAEHTGKDKSSTERFLKTFIAVVSEGVYADKVVKVKGLGTFKIIAVEKRESIHVNTGERFLIPEHYKFSFLPDKELKELVNKPFSFFETTELNDNADFSDLEISDDTEEKEAGDESIEEVMPEEQPLLKEEIPVPPSQPEPEVNLLPEPEPEVNELPEPEANPRKPISKWLYIIAACIALFAMLNIAVYQNRDLFQKAKQPVATAVQPTWPHATAIDTVKPPLDAASPTPDVLPPADSSNIIAKVKIEPGSRLTLISLEYYGSKVFWVYLYDYNKAAIKNPNNVPIGTIIEVPSPQMYGINARDRASVRKAATLQTEILGGKL